MVLLTNSTFDGVVYNVERVMEQVLALKPDIVFLWDEAWFAFARFSSIMRQRTAMHVAAKLHKKYSTAAYRNEYEAHIAGLAKPVRNHALPDPDKVRIRVYATQSTHKTLSSLRQGSMIHIWDEDFVRKSEAAFHEAYMTHTSTSANYQILGQHGCRSAAGGVRRQRTRGKGDRAGHDVAPNDPRARQTAQVVRHHHHRRIDPEGTPRKRDRRLLLARKRLERHREGLGRG